MSDRYLFKGYMEVRQCTDCKKIYLPALTPNVCKKCGAKLLEDRWTLLHTETYRTDKCKVVIAKKMLFGWKVKKEGVEKNDKKGIV